MEKIGLTRGFGVFVLILTVFFANIHKLAPFNIKHITIITVCLLIITILKQQTEHHILQKLIKNQTEKYKSVLTHDIKTPVLAQIRAIELLLKGNLGTLNKEQEEILKLTLNSCKHSYKIIRAQLYR